MPTQISPTLADNLVARLKARSKETGVPQAKIIERALERELGSGERIPPPDPDAAEEKPAFFGGGKKSALEDRLERFK